VSSALLFFQNSVGANANVIATPAPLHGPDGRMIPACYTCPPTLAPHLESKLGAFPLHEYWGPMAGAASSRWIAAATELIIRGGAPDLVFVYLPHLDYDLQRFGPDSPQAAAAVKELAGLLEQLGGAADKVGYEFVISGDYAIEPATAVAYPNRLLREVGLLAVRRVGPFELPDFGASPAFAVVDHQIAHVYCQNGLAPEAVIEALEGAPGIGRILDRAAQAELGVDHARAGDLIFEAAPGAWFAYDWWTDEACAPPYAKTVDIHNKPGYDPLELFFAPDKRGTGRDAAQLKGTHGRSGGRPAALVLPESAKPPAGRIKATDVAGLLADLAAG
jgi:hypothetical protein